MLQDAGAPVASTDLLGTYIYRLGSRIAGLRHGVGAVSIFVLVLTIALSWFYVPHLIKEDER